MATDKRVIVRTSERRDFKRCPQRWSWSWRKGLASRRDANPLWFGQGVHLALAEWYQPGFKRGPHPVETWDAFVADEERFIPVDYEEDEMKYVEARDLGREMLTNYVELYDKDPRWNVIATEQQFQFLIPDPRKRATLMTYAGTFDGVYRDEATGEIWLMEHKTAKAIMIMHLALDDQAGSYDMVANDVLRKAGLIGRKEAISGVMYNFLRKGKADDRPVDELGRALNKDGSVSKRQPSPLFHREPVWRNAAERQHVLANIQSEGLHMEAMRTGALPLYKNPTRDCFWDCTFYRMCQLHEAGEDFMEFAEAELKVRDPYADHRQNRKSA